MSGNWVSIVSLLGCLVLAGSALGSYQMGLGKMVRLVLIWIAIFCGVTFVISLMGF